MAKPERDASHAEADVPAAWRRFESSLEHGWHSDLSSAHSAAALTPLVAP